MTELLVFVIGVAIIIGVVNSPTVAALLVKKMRKKKVASR